MVGICSSKTCRPCRQVSASASLCRKKRATRRLSLSLSILTRRWCIAGSATLLFATAPNWVLELMIGAYSVTPIENAELTFSVNFNGLDYEVSIYRCKHLQVPEFFSRCTCGCVLICRSSWRPFRSGSKSSCSPPRSKCTPTSCSTSSILRASTSGT